VSRGEVVSFDTFPRGHLREIEKISAQALAKK
jgi:hypothetical protein